MAHRLVTMFHVKRWKTAGRRPGLLSISVGLSLLDSDCRWNQRILPRGTHLTASASTKSGDLLARSCVASLGHINLMMAIPRADAKISHSAYSCFT